MVRALPYDGVVTMRFSDLKAALQPSLDTDLGKLYADFVRESGTGDLARFIGHLKDEGLVEPKLLEQLVSDGGIDADAVQGLARQNTPKPARGRLHAPTLMPEVDDDEEDDTSAASPEGETEAASEDASEAAAEPVAEAPEAADAPAEAETAEAAVEPEAAEPGVAATEAVEQAEAEATSASEPEVAEPEASADAAAAVEAVEAVEAASEVPDDVDTPTNEGGDDRPKRRSEAGSTGSRPKRRSEAGSTGARSKTRDEARSTGGRRRSGGRRTSSRTGTGARRKAGESGAAGKSTSARDRLKRTMFSLRQQANETTETTDILRRDYDFVGKVGEGAMGRVLKAKDKDLLRLVAYKEMSEEIASNAALASKFYAEAQITAQLDHPNIVPVYQLEQNADGMLAYTMKLIKGKTVEDYIDEVKEAYQKHGKRKLPEEYTLEKRLEIFLRCCDALFYAHRRGVVHRDLKPENIMIGAYGEVYIMDWGIAKVVRQGDIITEDPIELIYEPEEEPDLIIGTPQYMSPEQANGDNADLDHRSDQYSMGLILYELLSCNQAVTGKSAMKIVMRQQDAEKDPLQHAFGDRMPRELRGVMEKTTTKAKNARYVNIKAVADDIRHYLRDEPVKAKPDSLPQAMGRWIRRNTAITAFVVLALLSMAGVGVVAVGAGAAIYTFQESAYQTKLNGLRSSVFAQASMIDGQFIKYEGLLGTVTATASEKLTLSAAEEGKDFYSSQHFDGEVVDEDGNKIEVPGMAKSKLYGSDLSLEFPVFHLPQGADEELGKEQILKLANIGPNLRTVLLRSESEEAARFTPARYKRRIAQQGTPITWAFIGLDSGAYVHYPGRAGLSGYDPREQKWYTDAKDAAKRQPGPRWSPPFPDYHGRGYVMTVSQPLYDVDDSLLGVSGVSLTFDYVIDTFLELPENIKGVREVLILDEEGQVLISTEDAGKSPAGGRSGKAKRTPVFEVDEVVKSVKSFEKAGLIEDAEVDDKAALVFYNRMEGLGWYLVVVGDPSEMLSSDI